MTNLKKNDIASIGIRLLAIYVALQMIGSLPSWLMTISIFFGQTTTNISYPFSLKFLAILLPILSLFIPFLLWLSANKIAGCITKTSNMIDKRIDQHDIQAMLFCSIGIFVLVTTLPEFIAWLYADVKFNMHSTSMLNLFQQAPFITTFITISLKIVLSIILIFTAKNLSTFFYKLRYAGK